MNRILYVLLLLFAASVGMIRSDAEADTLQDRPNIIVVMADDMGFSDPGCYGGEIRTPTIDQLATEGLRFSHFYNCALCGPSRASLMTGCDAWRVGQAPGKGIFTNLEKNCATILELLKANGYQTCAVGRLDMLTGDDWHDPTALARCADRFLGSVSGGPGNYYREAKGTPWYRNGERYDRKTGDYSTDLISDFVADFIEESADNEDPFFIYVSHYAPHWPLQEEEENIAPYRKIYEDQERTDLMKARLERLVSSGLVPQGTTLPQSMLHPKRDLADRELPTERMAIHAAMVESIDRSLGKTMAALKKSDQLENTLILVFSDNGSSHQMSYNRPLPEGARPGGMNTFLNHGSALAALSNTPFRNFKTSNYEGGIASPLVAWWPKGIQNQGRISHTPCHIVDIMPTCLELAHATYPAQFKERKLIPLAGQSLVKEFQNPNHEQPPRTLLWPRAIRKGDWKLLLGKTPELYNLSSDRNEKTNRAKNYPERVLNLKRTHEELYRGTESKP